MERYISFDVFDTLIKRSVAQPTDIFRLMETASDNQGQSLPKGFAGKRIEAERSVTKKKGKPATFKEIYDKLQINYGQQARNWMQLELQMEMAGCRPNPDYVSKFYEYLEKGHKIILISDMYLPSSFIAKMLEKCGIRGYMKLYVSCEYGARKIDGSLFQAVLGELGIKPWQLLHIGDARRADFAKPLSMGIHVKFPVAKNQKKLCRIPPFVEPESALSYRTLQASIANCCRDMNEYQTWGCTFLGPILVGYAYWLAERLRKDEIRDVYFFSRDGWMLMQAFNAFHIPNIRAHYLYTSRRAYLVPILWMNPDKNAVIEYINPLNRKMKLSEFLGKIGLNPINYAGKAIEYGLFVDHAYAYDVFAESKVFELFYDEIKEDVIRQSRMEYTALVSYLKCQNLPDRIAVADIGNLGSIQYAMQKVLNLGEHRVDIKGYYLGIAPSSRYLQKKRIQAEGFLYDIDKNESYNELLKRATLLYELQFLKTEGSLEKIQIIDGKAVPQFKEKEFMLQTTGFSEASFWAEYQNGAVSFAEYCFHAFGGKLKVEPSAAIWNWLRLINNPTLNEAAFFGNFHVENGYIRQVAHSQPLTYYLLHPRAIKIDYYESAWKVGFCKRLLRIPLPYGKVYDALKGKSIEK